jgi:DNA-binding beta-propeller fold protein YncE
LISYSIRGLFNQTAAEISAYDALSQRLFVPNGATNSLDILNISNPQAPTLFNSISLNPYGGAVNSMSVKNGLVAVAATPKTNNGTVAFFSNNGTPLNSVTVGALPDMLTFTPDGTKVLVANEGEPEPISTQPGRSTIYFLPR